MAEIKPNRKIKTIALPSTTFAREMKKNSNDMVYKASEVHFRENFTAHFAIFSI